MKKINILKLIFIVSVVFVLLPLNLALAAAAYDISPPQSAKIYGTVHDKATGNPIVNAKIYFKPIYDTFDPSYGLSLLWTKMAVTDINGYYEFDLVSPTDKIDITASTVDYHSQSFSNVELLLNGEKEINFSLKRKIEPVIIVPGILGSWKTSNGWVLDPILHTYDYLYETLEKAGYMPHIDLYTFAYDWSISNILTAQNLKNRIKNIKNALGVSKVDLVAHSMGGLVARQYIESNSYESDVDQVIFLGTPHLGATKTYLKWEGAAGFEGPKEFLLKKILQLKAYIDGYDDLYDYIHDQESVEELLPVYDYLIDEDTGELRDYSENNIEDYPQNEFLENLNSEDNLQKFIDSGVRTSNIVSDSDPGTLNTITVQDSDDEKLWEHGEPVGYGYGEGDGTVPIDSAKGFMGDHSQVVAAAHKDLPTAARKEVAVLLDDGLVIDDLGGEQELVEIDDFLFITIHSPIDVLIIDSGNAEAGAGSDSNNQIQGAFYSGEDDPEFITIPNPISGDYVIKVIGTGTGEYEIVITYLNDDGEEEVEIITGIASPGEIYYHTVNLDNCQLFQAAVFDNPGHFGFYDTETSSGNTYSMGSLDFSLDGNGFEVYNFPAGVVNKTEINITNQGSLDFQYTIHTSTSGDLCEDLKLTADLLSEDGIEYENVDLVGFASSATTTIGEWEFTITSDAALASGNCEFDFVFQGWQENVANYGDGGFSDEEIINNIIFSESEENLPTPDDENSKQDEDSGPADYVVINEAQIAGDGEWVELYNPTNANVDLTDWKWGYYSSTKGSWNSPTKHKPLVSGATTTIEAYGYFLFRVDGTVPNFDGDTGYSGDSSTLANNNGTVAIFNSNTLATSTLVDAVGWGSVMLKEGDSAVAPNENKSIERGLTGYDSDNNSIDFIIKNNPTPVNSSGEGMPDIVINEFLAEGNVWQDFVEIYNASSSPASLVGWMIEVENDYGTGSTTDLSEFTISDNSWLVIYYEDEDVLRASSTITIYDASGNEADKIFYTNADIEDKSFARISDGSANWVDPIPSPGKTNTTLENLILADMDPEIDYSVRTTTDDVVINNELGDDVEEEIGNLKLEIRDEIAGDADASDESDASADAEDSAEAEDVVEPEQESRPVDEPADEPASASNEATADKIDPESEPIVEPDPEPEPEPEPTPAPEPAPEPGTNQD